MAILQQSTDRAPAGDTNRLNLQVLKRGTQTINITSAVAGGYTGSATIEVAEIGAATAFPMFFVHRDGSGGGQTQFIMLPWHKVFNDGSTQFEDHYAVQSSDTHSGNYLELSIVCFSTTSITRTFYWQMCTTEAGPFLGSAWAV